MKKTIIAEKPRDGRGFSSLTSNTDMSQRDTLEEIMINLATTLGVEKILKAQSARGGYFYEVQAPGFICYQSASNIILELSRVILERSAK